jgi:cell division protein FtsX
MKRQASRERSRVSRLWPPRSTAIRGLESLPGTAGNPLPGYIQIRIRRDRFDAADVEQVISVLRPLPAVAQVLSGGDSLPRLLRAARYAAVGSWTVFGAFFAAFFLLCALQEQVRVLSSSGAYRYLLDRGAPRGRIVSGRAVGSALWCLFLAAFATGAATAVLSFLLGRFSLLRAVIGPAEDLLTPSVAVAACAFILSAALLSAGASLLGWRSVGASGN